MNSIQSKTYSRFVMLNGKKWFFFFLFAFYAYRQMNSSRKLHFKNKVTFINEFLNEKAKHKISLVEFVHPVYILQKVDFYRRYARERTPNKSSGMNNVEK